MGNTIIVIHWDWFNKAANVYAFIVLALLAIWIVVGLIRNKK